MSTPVARSMIVVVEGPGAAGWWSAPISALSTAGVLTRRVVVTPPGRGSTRPAVSNVADLDAVLRQLPHHRLILVGAGYAAAVIVDLLATGPHSSVSQVVLVEPEFSSGPPGAAGSTPATPSAALSALHQVPVPVFLARSRLAAGFAPDGAVVPDPGGLIVRVYSSLTESLPGTAEFVDDLFDFLGIPAPS